MAKSHNQVGIDFGNLKFSSGSRMSSINHHMPSPHLDDMTAIKTTNNLFYRVQDGVSYRTVVARIVRNVHTKTNELWITPRAYSSSTQRHKNYLIAGFRKANPNPTGLATDDNTHPHIYTTAALEDGLNRNSPTYVQHAIRAINLTLQEVDKPRLREATRRGTIASCIHKANRTLHNFTHNIPLDMIDADAFYDMQAVLGFLTETAALTDIDAIRAAVRGYLALNATDKE